MRILSDSGYRHFFDQHDDMSTTYTIAELAREFDITARAIRFYEDHGLLSPSREGAGGRSRVYTARDRQVRVLDFREVGPQAARPDMYILDGQPRQDLANAGVH